MEDNFFLEASSDEKDSIQATMWSYIHQLVLILRGYCGKILPLFYFLLTLFFVLVWFSSFLSLSARQTLCCLTGMKWYGTKTPAIMGKNKPIHFLAKQKNTSLNKNRKAKFVSWHLLYMLLIKSESLGMVCLAHVKKKSKNQNKISRAQCMSYSHSS